MDVVDKSKKTSSDPWKICKHYENEETNLLEADETNLDYIKKEVEDENRVQQDIEVQEEEICHQIEEASMRFLKVETEEIVQAQQYTDVEDVKIEESDVNSQQRKVILKRQSSHDYAVISDVYSLLEDYKTMARSGRSLLCCQPPVFQALVKCVSCGEQFLGKADRLLKLCKHIELVHPSDALELILETVQQYDVLITHMRKTIEFDKLFGTIYYRSGTMLLLHDL